MISIDFYLSVVPRNFEQPGQLASMYIKFNFIVTELP